MKTLIIKNHHDCPFLFLQYDTYWFCTALDGENELHDNGEFDNDGGLIIPIPEWCPLLKSSVRIMLDKKVRLTALEQYVRDREGK